ncbi:MAG: deoxyribose-phosphate aldolase [Hespellia sp.]|nr:deoxyribose-phosphate aldolase [Hespellia sp.]
MKQNEKTLNKEDFRRLFPTMIDLSCVRGCHSRIEIHEMAVLAKEIQCAAVFAMPSQTSYLIKEMKGTEIPVGGVVGFPSGAQTTAVKVFEATELVKMGCLELDMVMNQNELRNHNLQYVKKDIEAVVEVAKGIPVKVILEITNLSREEIETACKIISETGAKYIKSGTGWMQSGTTVEHIKQMRKFTKSDIKTKAAGGIEDMDMAYQMYLSGCERFGLGINRAKKFLKDI